MRKIFFLIPALILAMMVNATEIPVNPTTPRSIAIAASGANPGDVLVLSTGTYTNPYGDDYAKLQKNLTIKAADGESPIVKFEVPFRVSNAASVKFIGIQFDGQDLKADVGYNYYFRVNSNEDNSLEFEDCEFFNTDRYMIYVHDGFKAKSLKFKNCKFYNNTNYIITTSTSAHVDACEIDGCYFHDNTWNPVYFPASSVEGKQTCSDLKVINSTFANIDCTPEYRSVIDIKPYGEDITDAIKVVVDHCTFYNNLTINSDHSAIRPYKLSDVTISNCIFAHGSSYERRATCCWGGSVSNCLTYNLTKDADKNGHGKYGGEMVLTENLTADPLFTDAEHADYSFANNWVTMSVSPACAAATDGSDLGDPRWHTAATLPSVDFATPYPLTGNKAILLGKIWYDGENGYLYGDGGENKIYGTARWKFHAETACAASVVANLNSGNTSGHKLRIDIFDVDGNNVEFAEDASTLPGALVIPAAGDYVVVLHNDQEWSSAKIDDVTLSYMGGAVQNMPGTTDIDEAWFSAKGTRTAGTKIVIPAGYQHEGWVKWNVSFANTASYKAKVNINGTNGHNYTVALYKDEDDLDPITWSEGGQTSAASPLDLGAKVVPAGNYILKVTNAVQYSDAELISVQFVPAGGGLVNIPGDIDFNEAILSSRAYIDGNGEIRFTNDEEAGHVTEESVKWRVNVSTAGYYKFTTSVNSENGHSYLVSVYNADETVLKGSVEQVGTDIWGAPKIFSTDYILLEAGEYRLKVQNTTPDSKGRIVSISASYEGGAVIDIPNNTIPFNQALLYNGATRDLTSDPQEIHFGSVDAYAQWFVQATAGLYTFTFDVVGTDHGKYNLMIIDSQNNTIYNDFKGKDNSGSVDHANILLAAGNYTIKVANINSGSVGYITHITASALENLFILDENTEADGSIAAVDETQKRLLLKRSFTAGKYYTLCIPLEPGSGERTNIFGAGYELWRISTAEQVGEEINLTFEEVPANEFAAGTPYIIKPTQDVENPIFDMHTIHNTTSNNIKYRTAANFIGTFYKDVIPAGEKNLYLQNNNLYYNENNDTPIKGTRAWVQLKTSNNVMARIILGGQTATKISLVNGELVNGTVKTIENGQLVIIRDGKKYNVMGIKLQ